MALEVTEEMVVREGPGLGCTGLHWGRDRKDQEGIRFLSRIFYHADNILEWMIDATKRRLETRLHQSQRTSAQKRTSRAVWKQEGGHNETRLESYSEESRIIYLTQSVVVGHIWNVDGCDDLNYFTVIA
ncbi:unnamed protein product [Caenorhabditis sp. 36 PRJEB53466]|nr:unnamed protein product [Caenorhabditis sp. 36 PRJEB53466]